jgi:hypothetical protein
MKAYLSSRGAEAFHPVGSITLIHQRGNWIVTKAQRDEPRNGYEKIGGLACRPTLVASSYQRFYDALTTQERSRGQFSETREAEALQERLGCREAQATVCTGKFLHKLEISERHDEPALVGIEETIDFRLADWQPKGDAGEHFERGGH